MRTRARPNRFSARPTHAHRYTSARARLVCAALSLPSPAAALLNHRGEERLFERAARVGMLYLRGLRGFCCRGAVDSGAAAFVVLEKVGARGRYCAGCRWARIDEGKTSFRRMGSEAGRW